MADTEKNLLEAAVRLFSRYGVKRTSMSDLATEAGVSRQTLYHVFRNKDEVLRALIRAYTDDLIAGIESGLEGVQALGDQLDVVFAKMVVAGFEFVETTPNAQDIIDGFNAAGQEELEASAERFRALLERLFSPHGEALAHAGLSASELAEFVQRTAKAASHAARDKDQLLRQLKTLKQLCLTACR
ncbi:TetR/AcrR family transcriptional regulator [Acidihalobacter ferrooxydans]|uniref:HTH tetR-type domain-containing protein n=1 Tax=Acidihalobacter ferrooxydans TaxID=1765967 RepID=A0A1P8UKJ1_9GAMM|nr:TetR/AcrR family transcriptional regulator [Acidihalobacter ferrooxydans]APZ44343.1 hypothetical protein BW247_15650 [Acidihalobacter ferrooxydans]